MSKQKSADQATGELIPYWDWDLDTFRKKVKAGNTHKHRFGAADQDRAWKARSMVTSYYLYVKKSTLAPTNKIPQKADGPHEYFHSGFSADDVKLSAWQYILQQARQLGMLDEQDTTRKLTPQERDERMVRFAYKDWAKLAWEADGSPEGRDPVKFYDIKYHHRLRNCLEDYSYPDAQALYDRYAQLKALSHPDAKYGLLSGLVIALQQSQGNIYKAPYVFQGPLADKARALRWDEVGLAELFGSGSREPAPPAGPSARAQALAKAAAEQKILAYQLKFL